MEHTPLHVNIWTKCQSVGRRASPFHILTAVREGSPHVALPGLGVFPWGSFFLWGEGVKKYKTSHRALLCGADDIPGGSWRVLTVASIASLLLRSPAVG